MMSARTWIAEPFWAKIAGSQAALNSPAKTAATFFARFESFSPASVTVGNHATSKADSRFVSMKAELLHGRKLSARRRGRVDGR